MPAKKKGIKGQKVNLNEFLSSANADGGSSWADDDFDLPSAPMQSTGNTLVSLSDAPDRKDIQQSQRYAEPEEVPFPTEPPYDAFLGNLALEATIDDIKAHFSALNVEDAHLFTYRDTGKSKGIAVLNLSSADDLRAALDMSGTSICGREIKVSISRKRQTREGGDGGSRRRQYEPTEADRDNEWRSHSNVPARQPSNNYPRQRTPNVSESDNVNDWRTSRKPTQQRNNNTFESQGRRDYQRRDNYEPREGPPKREYIPTPADTDSAWRRHPDPVLPSPAESQPQTRQYKPRQETRAETADVWRRSGTTEQPQAKPRRAEGTRNRYETDAATKQQQTRADEANTWRRTTDNDQPRPQNTQSSYSKNNANYSRANKSAPDTGSKWRDQSRPQKPANDDAGNQDDGWNVVPSKTKASGSAKK